VRTAPAPRAVGPSVDRLAAPTIAEVDARRDWAAGPRRASEPSPHRSTPVPRSGPAAPPPAAPWPGFRPLYAGRGSSWSHERGQSVRAAAGRGPALSRRGRSRSRPRSEDDPRPRHPQSQAAT
jgi:hypothetical protein